MATQDLRLEILLATLIVVAGALSVREAFIPPFPERQVVLAGEKYDLDLGEPNRWFSAWSVGDGQAFAVIAADPAGVKLSEEVKEPAYRLSRAGFGWLSAVVSLGQQRWIPYAMALVGAAAVLGTLWLAGAIREALGAKAWLLILNPAVYLGFAGDTAEPLAAFVLAYATATGAVWASIAVGVSRPSFLTGLLGRPRLIYGLAAAVLLTAYSAVRFGVEGLISEGERFAFPVTGFVDNPSIFGWALCLFALVTLWRGFRHRDLAWSVSALLVLSLGADVTFDIANAWRAAGMLPVLWAFGPGHEPSVSPIGLWERLSLSRRGVRTL